MVKFGKYLLSHTVVEWASNYIDYKKLKKALKQIKRAQEPSSKSGRRKLTTLFGKQEDNVEEEEEQTVRQHLRADGTTDDEIHSDTHPPPAPAHGDEHLSDRDVPDRKFPSAHVPVSVSVPVQHPVSATSSMSASALTRTRTLTTDPTIQAHQHQYQHQHMPNLYQGRGQDQDDEKQLVQETNTHAAKPTETSTISPTPETTGIDPLGVLIDPTLAVSTPPLHGLSSSSASSLPVHVDVPSCPPSHAHSLFHKLVPPTVPAYAEELSFFHLLHAELDKINHFFAQQEQFFVTTVEVLTKQMQQMFSAPRLAPKRPRGRRALAQASSSNIATTATTMPSTNPATTTTTTTTNTNTTAPTAANSGSGFGSGSTRGTSPAPSDPPHSPHLLSHAIGLDPIAPTSTSTTANAAAATSHMQLPHVTAIIKGPLDALAEQFKRMVSSSISLRRRKRLELAVRELYRGLNLLKNYRILNYTGFVKILKKHDKMSQFQATPVVLPIIEQERFKASPVLEQFLIRVERIFVSAFASGDRHRGMDMLRVSQTPLSNWVVFELGWLLGLITCAIIVLGLLIGQYVNVYDGTMPQHVTAVFPVFRALALILLHIWLWGVACYIFERKRINHPFIFEMDPKTHLTYVHILMFAATMTMLFFLALNLYLYTSLTYSTKSGYIPLALFVTIFGCFLLPFNVLFRASRVYILRTLFNLVTAPFSQVNFKEFFFGDQLTSLVSVQFDIAYSICYFTTGAFVNEDTATCTSATSTATWILAFLPYYWRLQQCIRLYYERRVIRHAYNAGKYFTSMMVTLTSLLNKFYATPATLAIWIIIAIAGSSYSYFWDIKMDWGLFEKGSRHRFLRSELVFEHRWIYYGAMILDLVLRVSWILTISPQTFGIRIHKDFLVLLLYSGEILRRSTWNVFRLEHEHLHNCEQFRAVNIVPLPLERGEQDQFNEQGPMSSSGRENGDSPKARVSRVRVGSRDESEPGGFQLLAAAMRVGHGIHSPLPRERERERDRDRDQEPTSISLHSSRTRFRNNRNGLDNGDHHGNPADGDGDGRGAGNGNGDVLVEMTSPINKQQHLDLTNVFHVEQADQDSDEGADFMRRDDGSSPDDDRVRDRDDVDRASTLIPQARSILQHQQREVGLEQQQDWVRKRRSILFHQQPTTSPSSSITRRNKSTSRNAVENAAHSPNTEIHSSIMDVEMEMDTEHDSDSTLQHHYSNSRSPTSIRVSSAQRRPRPVRTTSRDNDTSPHHDYDV